jgi:DNA-directed RNA polymerase beta subunit
MPTSPASHLASHRQRLKERGIVRVEVRVRKDDEALVKRVVAALNDPEKQEAARSALKRALAPAPAVDLKALLASVSLEGLDLRRDKDLPRDVDL